MNTDEFIQQMEQRLEQLDVAALILPVAAKVHAMQVERIFGNGESATGTIGSYSTKPMYAGQKQFGTGVFTGIGKSGKTNFKSGKPHHTMFLPEGYQQLKSLQGYESSFVNLTDTGNLKQDFTNSLSANTDGSINTGLSNAENTAKLESLKAKYGKDLFALTDDEKSYFKNELAKALNDYLFGY